MEQNKQLKENAAKLSQYLVNTGISEEEAKRRIDAYYAKQTTGTAYSRPKAAQDMKWKLRWEELDYLDFAMLLHIFGESEEQIKAIMGDGASKEALDSSLEKGPVRDPHLQPVHHLEVPYGPNGYLIAWHLYHALKEQGASLELADGTPVHPAVLDSVLKGPDGFGDWVSTQFTIVLPVSQPISEKAAEFNAAQEAAAQASIALEEAQTHHQEALDKLNAMLGVEKASPAAQGESAFVPTPKRELLKHYTASDMRNKILLEGEEKFAELFGVSKAEIHAFLLAYKTGLRQVIAADGTYRSATIPVNPLEGFFGYLIWEKGTPEELTFDLSGPIRAHDREKRRSYLASLPYDQVLHEHARMNGFGFMEKYGVSLGEYQGFDAARHTGVRQVVSPDGQSHRPMSLLGAGNGFFDHLAWEKVHPDGSKSLVLQREPVAGYIGYSAGISNVRRTLLNVDGGDIGQEEAARLLESFQKLQQETAGGPFFMLKNPEEKGPGMFGTVAGEKFLGEGDDVLSKMDKQAAALEEITADDLYAAIVNGPAEKIQDEFGLAPEIQQYFVRAYRVELQYTINCHKGCVLADTRSLPKMVDEPYKFVDYIQLVQHSEREEATKATAELSAQVQEAVTDAASVKETVATVPPKAGPLEMVAANVDVLGEEVTPEQRREYVEMLISAHPEILKHVSDLAGNRIALGQVLYDAFFHFSVFFGDTLMLRLLDKYNTNIMAGAVLLNFMSKFPQVLAEAGGFDLEKRRIRMDLSKEEKDAVDARLNDRVVTLLQDANPGVWTREEIIADFNGDQEAPEQPNP